MLSLAEISKDGKINKAGTQKCNKEAKEIEKKRKKVKQNAGCSHSETHMTQQKKARLISLPSSAGKQACQSLDAASQAWQEAYRSLDTHLSQARQACWSFDKQILCFNSFKVFQINFFFIVLFFGLQYKLLHSMQNKKHILYFQIKEN
jgi:hypothetical protein